MTLEAHLHWGAEALWQQLEPLLPGLSVEVVASSPSTNTALLQRARVRGGAADENGDVAVRRSVESAAFGRRAADAQPCLLVAEQQTRGRGRHGRVWQSAAGASLTFSLGVPLAMADWSGLSLAVGLALAEALDDAPAQGRAPRLGLKWPNDLWLFDTPAAGGTNDNHAAGGVVGRKLGGILIETVAAPAQRLAIVGIGLNVAPMHPVDAGTRYACLQELDPQATPPSVLHRVALPLVKALKRFEREGFGPLAPAYAQRDLLLGRAVQTTQPGVADGVARGVSPQGALLVETPGGLVSVTSGEISVRLETGTAPAA